MLRFGSRVPRSQFPAPHRRRIGRRAPSRWSCRSAPAIASDIIARVVFEQVGKQVGQTFVIENRPGAGGTIGANMVAKAAPDGHTILVYGAIAGRNALYAKLPYDTLNDFIPVMLVRPAAAAWWSRRRGALQDARRSGRGRQRPSLARSTIRRSASGSASHFGAERLRVSAGFEAQHIPFKRRGRR